VEGTGPNRKTLGRSGGTLTAPASSPPPLPLPRSSCSDCSALLSPSAAPGASARSSGVSVATQLPVSDRHSLSAPASPTVAKPTAAFAALAALAAGGSFTPYALAAAAGNTCEGRPQAQVQSSEMSGSTCEGSATVV
jgi:hypothetical protein